jgi:3-hydroxyacyl-[acyl-carrier-protein] dehydratase
MRWFWIDRFVEFQSGSHAKAIKNVTLAEEHLHDHFPGFPVMPGSLIIEGLAQTGGILLGEVSRFENLIVLAKIPKIEFHGCACPGDTLVYDVRLLDAREDGGIVECTAHVGDRLVAAGEIVFARIPRGSTQALSQESLLSTMQLLRVWEANSGQPGRAGGRPGESPGET